MEFQKLSQSDERAVSPVIGVILMVAITVILAAVIGTFVLGLGEELSDTAPQVSMNTGDITADAEPNGTGAGGFIVDLRHGGGDDLEMSNVRVIVENESDGTSFDFDQPEIGLAQTADTITITSDADSGSASVIERDTQTAETEDTGDGFDAGSGDQITITLVHKSSGEIIFDRTITL